MSFSCLVFRHCLNNFCTWFDLYVRFLVANLVLMSILLLLLRGAVVVLSVVAEWSKEGLNLCLIATVSAADAVSVIFRTLTSLNAILLMKRSKQKTATLYRQAANKQQQTAARTSHKESTNKTSNDESH